MILYPTITALIPPKKVLTFLATDVSYPSQGGFSFCFHPLMKSFSWPFRL